ncbi:hypothetical protein CEXT_508131 [Caerostris extrusa]|uniref:Uncharacterized protein n=1 Tax=Caerostris extrusa TaxID=172846 RepID=A0AAV4XYG3_CAEEX|nr:hypothetical protein CEXT_508131 [Caerostris extrusa]
MEDDRDRDIFARFTRLEKSRNVQLFFLHQTTPASLSFHCKRGAAQGGGKGGVRGRRHSLKRQCRKQRQENKQKIFQHNEKKKKQERKLFTTLQRQRRLWALLSCGRVTVAFYFPYQLLVTALFKSHKTDEDIPVSLIFHAKWRDRRRSALAPGM